MEIATVLALIQGVATVLPGLVNLAQRLQSGQEPTPEDHELLKQAQAIADKRFDDAVARFRQRHGGNQPAPPLEPLTPDQP